MYGNVWILYLVLVYWTWPMSTVDKRDYINKSDKIKLTKIAEELIRDAVQKSNQVDEIINSHSSFIAFEVGMIIGVIREKYKRMVEIYRQTRNKLTSKSELLGPGFVGDMKPVHYVINMELIHRLEVEIDKLVNVLEHLPKDQLDESFLDIMKKFKKKKKKKNMRTRDDDYDVYSEGDDETDLDALAEQLEEQIKSKYREEHLMRKLGLPPNASTTKKRFQGFWPVRDTWSKEMY